MLYTQLMVVKYTRAVVIMLVAYSRYMLKHNTKDNFPTLIILCYIGLLFQKFMPAM